MKNNNPFNSDRLDDKDLRTGAYSLKEDHRRVSPKRMYAVWSLFKHGSLMGAAFELRSLESPP